MWCQTWEHCFFSLKVFKAREKKKAIRSISATLAVISRLRCAERGQNLPSLLFLPPQLFSWQSSTQQRNASSGKKKNIIKTTQKKKKSDGRRAGEVEKKSPNLKVTYIFIYLYFHTVLHFISSGVFDNKIPISFVPASTQAKTARSQKITQK